MFSRKSSFCEYCKPRRLLFCPVWVCSRATDCRRNTIPTFTEGQWIQNFWKTHFSTFDAVCNQRWRGVTWITTVYSRQHESTLPCGNLWPAQSTGPSLICLVSIFLQCAFVYLTLQLKWGSWPKSYRYQTVRRKWQLVLSADKGCHIV